MFAGFDSEISKDQESDHLDDDLVEAIKSGYVERTEGLL
jgi:hypothetical protein